MVDQIFDRRKALPAERCASPAPSRPTQQACRARRRCRRSRSATDRSTASAVRAGSATGATKENDSALPELVATNASSSVRGSSATWPRCPDTYHPPTITAPMTTPPTIIVRTGAEVAVREHEDRDRRGDRAAAARAGVAAPPPISAAATLGRSECCAPKRRGVEAHRIERIHAPHREQSLQRHVRGNRRARSARPAISRLPAPIRISVLLPQPDASVMPKPNRKPPTRYDSHGTCRRGVDRLAESRLARSTSSTAHAGDRHRDRQQPHAHAPPVADDGRRRSSRPWCRNCTRLATAPKTNGEREGEPGDQRGRGVSEVLHGRRLSHAPYPHASRRLTPMARDAPFTACIERPCRVAAQRSMTCSTCGNTPGRCCSPSRSIVPARALRALAVRPRQRRDLRPHRRPGAAHLLSFDGTRYVVGKPGNEYAIRVRNASGERALAVMSVDGVNVITGDTASPSQSGYVLGPARKRRHLRLAHGACRAPRRSTSPRCPIRTPRAPAARTTSA